MLPLDSEFVVLYILYASALLYFLIGYLKTKKVINTVNLIVFAFYAILMVFIFVYKENFKGGNSLAVLFYGFLFLWIHFSINGLIAIVNYLRKIL